MDIEQTKRMNHMIKQLTAKGVVSEFGEAVQVASSLYDNAMPEQNSEQVVIEKKEVPKEAANLDMRLVDRKIKFAISHNNELINAQFQKMWDKMQSVKEDYERRIAALNAVPKPAAQATLQPPVQVQTEVPQATQKMVQTPSSAKEASSPRSGDFTPDNIVLENYFYCGR